MKEGEEMQKDIELQERMRRQSKHKHEGSMKMLGVEQLGKQKMLSRPKPD